MPRIIKSHPLIALVVIGSAAYFAWKKIQEG